MKFATIMTARPLAEVAREYGAQAAVVYAEHCRVAVTTGQARVGTSERELADVLGVRAAVIRACRDTLVQAALLRRAQDGTWIVAGWPGDPGADRASITSTPTPAREVTP